MIITDQFILLNFPKTGSTFARQVVLDLYNNISEQRSLFGRMLDTFLLSKRSCREIYLPKTEYINGSNEYIMDQHGRYEQVPRKYRSRPVLSIVRNPVVRNISFYEYGWWKNFHAMSEEEIMTRFPSFPDLDFRTYLEFQCCNMRYRDTGVQISEEIGEQTVHFIQFFFRNPKTVFRKLDDEYIYSGAYKTDMPKLTLLKTENLNQDLYKYLLGCGFTGEELGFINGKRPVRPENTYRKSEYGRWEYLTDELISLIKFRERYLYRIYADFGINY